MLPPYLLIPNFFNPEEVETLISEAKEFREQHYNPENLASHAAYLSDVHPTRVSHAFAVSEGYKGELPTLPLSSPGIASATRAVVEGSLELSYTSRMLFNIQEYRDESAPVPKHCDGEL